MILNLVVYIIVGKLDYHKLGDLGALQSENNIQHEENAQPNENIQLENMVEECAWASSLFSSHMC